MKKLLNTLYVTTENAFLALDGENIVITKESSILGRLPLHTLESVITFSYVGASPALMGKCAEMNIALVFLKPSGRFLAKVTGKSYGNILLRKQQYRICDNEEISLSIAKNIIAAKIKNQSNVLHRTVRNHELRIDKNLFLKNIDFLNNAAKASYTVCNSDSLRGLEGESASIYFSLFDNMILQQKEDFFFKARNRRPPTDNVNALLSFCYSLLTSMYTSALESVGLDPYSGFFHTDRPGRCSLALDLVEELRACFADRFVLSIINKKIIDDKDFIKKENGGVILKDDSRKKVLSLWQDRKKEELTHPFLKEKLQWGLVPYVQAMLLARYIRGDLNNYPPFFWK